MLMVFNACHVWYARPGMTIPEIVAEGPDRVRVTRADDPHKIVLVGPRMIGDTLFGMAGHWRARVGTPIPASEVRTIETRRLKPYATAATAVGVTAVTLGISFFIALLSADCLLGCR